MGRIMLCGLANAASLGLGAFERTVAKIFCFLRPIGSASHPDSMSHPEGTDQESARPIWIANYRKYPSYFVKTYLSQCSSLAGP